MMTDWLEVVVVTALAANVILVIALLMMLNNAAWDGTSIAGWATRTNAAVTVNANTVGGLAIRPIAP